MIGVLGRKMASFARAPLFTKAWFGPAWLLLGLGRLAVLVVPFRKIAPALGTAGTASSSAKLPSPPPRLVLEESSDDDWGLWKALGRDSPLP